MDAQGAEVARRFTEGAGATYTTAIDRAQGLWELYGFQVVPNGFFVDERGILRYLKIGGFDARNPEDAQAIETLLAAPSSGEAMAREPRPRHRTAQQALREAEEASRRDPSNLDKLLALAERCVEARHYARARKGFETVLERDGKSARALLGLASVYLDQGAREKASRTLKRAWAIEPDNWILRKQIWAIEHPDQFYPTINTGWQKEQINKENAARR